MLGNYLSMAEPHIIDSGPKAEGAHDMDATGDASVYEVLANLEELEPLSRGGGG